jgi:hypothetical protein
VDSPAVATLRVFFRRQVLRGFSGKCYPKVEHHIRDFRVFCKSPIFMGWANTMTVARLKVLLDFPQEWIPPQWRHCGIFFARFFGRTSARAIPNVNNR